MAQSSIPIPEFFWSLVDKADRKFSRLRDLPNYGRNRCPHRSPPISALNASKSPSPRFIRSFFFDFSRNDTDFHKAFKIYTQLWKLQQENRQKLVEAGLRRWEIGEIASRIAQLYYGQYQRTSDSSYLSEAYIFYEAILSREYFRDGASQDAALANKQLRFLARFLMVCLVLGRREMASRLVNQLKALVDECKKNFQVRFFQFLSPVSIGLLLY